MFVDLPRIYFYWLLVETIPTGRAICSDIRILTDVHCLMSVLMICKINRWENFKDKGHIFYIKPWDDGY